MRPPFQHVTLVTIQVEAVSTHQGAAEVLAGTESPEPISRPLAR